MTQFVPYLLRTGSVLAVAALLSACSSNNNTTRTTSNGDMTVPEPPPGPTADQVARTSLTGLDSSIAALTTLSAGADKEGSALKMAKDYSAMFETPKKRMEGFDGNSRKARQSAQKVLDAHKSLEDALTAAKTAKTAAEEAKEALPADAEPLLVKALDDAIKKADTQIEMAQALLDAKATEDDPTLAFYVARVTGDDEDDLQTAADQGKTVAEAIAAALAPRSATDGRPARSGVGDSNGWSFSPPSDTVPAANKVMLDDATGHTWAEIVGASDLKDRQITTASDGTTLGAGRTRSVKVASIAGLKVADVFGTGTALDTSDGGTGLPTALPDDLNGHEETTDGDGTATNHSGIPGTVICGGADCAAKDGILTGSWYFTPTEPMTHYVKVGDAKTYSPETQYTRYGHWLTSDEDGKPNIALYAGLPAADEFETGRTSAGSWDAAVPGATDPGMRQSTARYSGNAVGRSVRKFFDANDQLEDIQSGRFTADVTLKAEFGATAAQRLSGTVTNFKSPDNDHAVDPNWSVTLKGKDGAATALVTGGRVSGTYTTTNHGAAQGTAQQAGGWSAEAYGEASKRPVGIHGWFNAHFTNGAAVGVYATRKDD